MTPENDRDPFERELHIAMRHVELPGTLERYLEETLVFTPVQEKSWRGYWSRSVPHLNGFWIAGAATAILAVCFIVVGLHERNEHQVEATRQFARSEVITAQTLAYTRKQMQLKGFTLNLDDE